EGGGGEAAHIGRGVDPGEGGFVEPHVAAPAFAGDDGKVGAEVAFVVVHAGELADGHAVTDGDVVPGDEGAVAFADGAFDGEDADGVGAVEDEELFLFLRGGGEAFAEGGFVGVEAA